jgi:phage baseplate assembly protein gpV
MTDTLNITAATAVNLDTPQLNLSGEMQSQGDIKSGVISLTGHRHGGVQAGGGTTAVPQ